MRTIKFRVWNEESKTLTPDITLGTIAKEYCTILKRKTSEYVWEEFSGFKDSTGKDIYEGDIVYIAGQGETPIEFPFTDLVDAYPEGDIEKIIGNIHENPELL